MLSNGVSIGLNDFATIQGAMIQQIREAEMNSFSGMSVEEIAKWLGSPNTVTVAARLLKNEDYVNSLQAVCKAKLLSDSETMTWTEQTNEKAIRYLAADTQLVMRNTYNLEVEGQKTGELVYYDLLKQYSNTITSITERVSRLVKDDFSGTYLKGNTNNLNPTESDVNYDQMVDWYSKGMVYAIDDYMDRQSGGDGVPDKSNVISTLAKAFKEMAWTNTSTSWKPSKPVIQGALMYAILVAQSLIFFIAYAKRLFYVIILILVAPVIVVYDFFTKFSS